MMAAAPEDGRRTREAGLDTRFEMFFDCSSPWTWLGFERAFSLSRRTGVALRARPILVGGVFNAVNDDVYRQRAQPNPVKARWHRKDMADWARLVGIEINWPSVFPVNSAMAMRACLHADASGALEPFARAVFTAYWRDGRDISQEAEVAACAEAAGLDSAATLAAARSDAAKAALRANVDELIARGGFGSPTFFINGDDMYFGNDRMELIAAALARVAAGAGG